MLLTKCLIEGTGNISTGLAKVPLQRLKNYACVEKDCLVASWNFVPEMT
jgi:hypothetical protein